MRPGDTPVPIPNTKVKAWPADGTALETVWNTKVKAWPADGTALETVWESRWPPDSKKEKKEETGEEAGKSGLKRRTGQGPGETFRIDTGTESGKGSAANLTSGEALLKTGVYQ